MMENGNKFGILYVDDEAKSLKYFREMFQEIAPIFTAENAEEGIRVFEAHSGEIGVVLSDKRMPGISGIEFLEKVRSIDDQSKRMLVTAYADLDLAVEHLNDGLLYSYITKPWDPAELKRKLQRALDRFWICRERSRLLRDRAAFIREAVMAEKVSSIGTFSTGLNHHLRNSLSVIQGFFDMIPVQLEDELGGPPKDEFFWKDYYRNVEEQLARVQSIISDLTEGASDERYGVHELKIEEGVDLVPMIEAAGSEILGEDPAVDFSFIMETDQPAISADAGRISHLVHALIAEARKNIVESGKIEVSLSRTGDEAGHGSVRLRFVDDGEPVPEEERDKLFDPFLVRTNRPTDLGTELLTCYLTVYHHGGSIRADATGDGRNRIEVILPVEPVLPQDRESSRKMMDSIR